jgi:tRNA dimethylallyltransferase
VLYTTGQSITTFRTANKAIRDFNIIKIGVTVPKEQLHANIAHRVHAMIAAGLVDEVRAVLPYRHHNALQTVGYKEIFDYLDGKITLEEATELIIIHTRQYAKRQLTWFRKDPAMQWFDARDIEGVMNICKTARDS